MLCLFLSLILLGMSRREILDGDKTHGHHSNSESFEDEGETLAGSLQLVPEAVAVSDKERQ